MVETGTQTYGTEASFSPLTCLEIVDRLNPQQLDRELKLVCDPSVGTLPSNPKKMKAVLKNHFTVKIKQHNDELIDNIHQLTTQFSRDVERAGEDMEKLHEAIINTQDVLTSLQPLSPSSPSPTPPLPPQTAASPPNNGTTQHTGTGPWPYYKFSDSPFADFDMHAIDADTVYDRTFTNRKVAYYGEFPYSYPGGSHEPRDIKDNPTLEALTVAVRRFCEEQELSFCEFNSTMVTKYDSHQSFIPPHSDDESSIIPDSMILTVSLGAKRHVVFRRKPPGDYCEEILEVGQGDVYVMTRNSQDFFDHQLPKMREEDVTGPRISITFRSLRPQPGRSPVQMHHPHTTPSSTRPHTDSNARPRTDSTSCQPTPKRAFNPPRKQVLILSDSKNRSFDCSLFTGPVVAFRKDLFFLRDLSQHSDAIAQADVVLISAGVNDIRRNKVDARTIHDHVKNFFARFKNTQFLFDSISPVSMDADRFNHINDCINKTNEYMLKLSLRSDNFKLFDNLCFGLPHLARDGIHLNLTGKNVLSNCWVNVTLIKLGLKRGYVPLRYNFSRIAEEFYSDKG